MNPMTSSPINDYIYGNPQNQSNMDIMDYGNISCFFNSNSSNPYYLFGFITKGIIMNTVAVFGIIGNIISITILSRPQMKSSINCFLIGLGVYDTILILIITLLYGIPAIYPYTGYLFEYNFWFIPHIAPVVAPLGQIAQASSVVMIISVTIERFIAVCFPLQAKSICTYGRARILIIIFIIISIALHFLKFWALVCVEYTHDNGTIYCLKNKPQITTHFMFDIRYRLVSIYFFPFTVLAILNACIYWQVRKANARRHDLTTSQMKEMNLAMMLICVVLVFFLCYVVTAFIGALSLYGYSNSYLLDVVEVFLTINSSVNFIIYVAYGGNFKKLFLEIYCCRKCPLFNIKCL